MTVSPHPTEDQPGEPIVRPTCIRQRLVTELDFLRGTSDRSDPLAEAVLCIVEAAVLAIDAAERARTCGGPEVHGHLLELLAAARATVTAASFAVVRAHDAADIARNAPEPDQA
jgi:hypothetical protein